MRSPGILLGMKARFPERSSTAAGFMAGAVGLVLALSAFAAGCGDAGASGEGSSDPGTEAGARLPKLPPIDLLAPTDFETASFALG
ncbi:MAG: hypothetical protein LLG45_12865 [Actinomycetia bacterium]|nr:hypothetical protein [Actinomycetes bacterium]